MSGVYEGLTVVELADRRNQWAGKLLSDGGARVVQIEPVTGSAGRWCGPFVDDKVDPDRCLDYWWNNTGKQSVALDIERPDLKNVRAWYERLAKRPAYAKNIMIKLT